jgi:hypothetical protein
MFKYLFFLLLAVIAYFLFYFNITLTNDEIGKLFVAGILCCLALFLIFKFGLHYRIQALNRFANAFYYAVFEYKKAQEKPSNMTYMESVREQAEVALAANFDPTLATADLKIPATLYSGKDPLLDKLRAKIQKAEKLKLEARHLNRKADVLIGKTEEELAEKDLADKKQGKLLDRIFDIEKGVATIIDLTVDELRDQGYDREPDYGIITRIAFDNNPYFSRTYRFFDSEDIISVLVRAPFMTILLGIIGTFAGFYLALNHGGDIKSGASVAILSSLVGLPVSLLMDHINTLFPDKEQYQQAFNKFKITLEMLFNHEQELYQELTESEAEKLKEEKELALAKAEQERLDALAKQEAEFEKQRHLEVAKTAQELKEKAEREAEKLKEEKELALAKAEQERLDALAKQQAELEKQRQLELARAEQALKEQAEREAVKLKEEKELALAKQQAELEKQKHLEVAKTEQAFKEQAEREAAKLKKERKLALAKLAEAKQERLDALAKKEAELEKQRQLEVAKTAQELKEQAESEAEKLKEEKELALGKLAEAKQERLDALAKQQAELEKQRRLEVAKTAQELKEQAESEAEKLKEEKEFALAEAEQKHQSDLAAQKSALEKEMAKALSEKEQAFALKLDQQKKLLAKVAEEFATES